MELIERPLKIEEETHVFKSIHGDIEVTVDINGIVEIEGKGLRSVITNFRLASGDREGRIAFISKQVVSKNEAETEIYCYDVKPESWGNPTIKAALLEAKGAQLPEIEVSVSGGALAEPVAVVSAEFAEYSPGL